MPIYDSPYASKKGASSSTGYTNTGYGGYDSGGTFDLSDPAPKPANDSLRGPGTISFDLTDPVGSINEGVDTTNDVLGGALAGLFGTQKGDPNDKHGGLIGDIPLVGALARGLGEVGANVVGAGGEVVKGVSNTLLDRLPSPVGQANALELEKRYAALPADSAAKIAAEEKMAAPDSQGLFGSDVLSLKPHLKAVAVQEYERENLANNPDLTAGIFRPEATWGETLNNLFGVMETGVRVVQRGIAGWDKADGMNRLKAIMAVGDGNGTFVTGGILGSGIGPDWTPAGEAVRGLTPQEQVVYDKYNSGEWTQDQSLNYLSAVGAGYSHDTSMNIAGSIALDPINLATFGAGAVAKFGRTGAKLISTANDARIALEEGQALRVAAEAAGDVAGIARADETITGAQKLLDGAMAGIKSSADPVSARNILGQLAKVRATGSAARAFGSAYASTAAGREYAAIGRLAKSVRTMVDPISMWGGAPKVQASISEGSRQVAHAFISAHGEGNAAAVLHRLDELGGETLRTSMENGWAVWSANRLRSVVGSAYRAAQMSTVGDLLTTQPFEHLANLTKGYSKSSLTRLEEDVIGHIKYEWTDDDIRNLAKRQSTLNPGRLSTDEWYAELSNGKVWTPQRLSLLHSSEYGTAVTDLHTAIRQVINNGETGQHLDRMHQIILINKQTLTDLGAEGILKRLGNAQGDIEAQMAIMREAKAEYPSLRNFAEDPTSSAKTLDEFVGMLNDRMPSLPAQFDYAERGALPPSLREFAERIGGASPDGSEDIYTLAFRPEDKFLWGIEADKHGAFSVVGEPWFDQVSMGVETYSPVRELSYNVSGGVAGYVVSKGARALDNIEMAGRTVMHGVTGSMIAAASKGRFVQSMYRDFGGGVSGVGGGLTEKQVAAIWDSLSDFVGNSRDYSSIRGLSKNTMWDAAKAAIPDWAERAGLDRRALMLHILHAYNGDLRHVGLTQKFTGTMKEVVGRVSNANTLGEISEHLWPMLKFRYNPIFQVQEKVEPWILNAQRGAAVAIGSKITEGDQITAGIFRNLVENNLVATADNDIAELGKLFAWGKGMDSLAQSNSSQLNRFGRALEALREVQYGKQLNQMRTFQKGLGKELKAVWEATEPGKWDEIMRHEQVLAGRILTDDEFAVRMAAQNGAANDIIVNRILDGAGNLQSVQTNFRNAINVGRWAEPGHIGDLTPINLEEMVLSLGLRAGAEDIGSLNDLRRGLARGTINMDQVTRALRDLSAHPDYIQRVESAFAFNWDGFWNSAKDAFSLSDDEVARFQTLFRSMATRQGMSPTEYMSQIYQPVVLNGGAFSPGALGALVEVTRNGRLESAPSLAALTGTAGASTVADLYSQMSSVMATHLHPSAKLSFLMSMVDPSNAELTAFQTAARNGAIDIDSRMVEEMFQTHGRDALSQSLLGYVQGVPGTGAQRVVEAPGVESVLNAQRMYLAGVGSPRATGRVLHELDEGLATRFAAAHDARPRARELPTTAVTSKVVVADEVAKRTAAQATVASLKPNVYMSPAIRDGYVSVLRDTRSMYRYITENMHVRVQFVDDLNPYATADALRADLALANPRLKIPKSGYWHPVYEAEDMAAQRVVDDVFGYGPEKVEFGDINAVRSVTSMYTPESQGQYLADAYGQRAWETHSDGVIPTIEAEASTLAAYKNRWGEAASRETLYDTSPTTRSTHSIGDGLLSASESVQNKVFETLGPIRNEFPTVPLDGIELGDLTFMSGPGEAPVLGATMTFKGEHNPTIILHRGAGWQDDLSARAMTVAERRSGHQLWRAANGLRPAFSDTPQGDLLHEFGHAVDHWLKRQWSAANGRWSTDYDYLNPRLGKLMRDLEGNPSLNRQISHYGSENADNPLMPKSERFSEAFDLAFNPDYETFRLGMDAHDGEMISPELQKWVKAFKRELERDGVYVPGGGIAPEANRFAGQTVAQANAAGAGLRAPVRIGPMEPRLVDDFVSTYIGQGRYPAGDPNVARMSGFLHDYMQDHLAAMMEDGSAAPGAFLMDGLPGAPIVPDPVPYDFTQARLRDGMVQALASKWQDSFRLQYFAQNRSMLQRSINHPMFGLYPASYMWGKIGPELFKFMAYEPFGVNSGAALYTLADMQKAVAMQRQYDPEFDKRINELGSSAAISFLGYMLPATLWEVPASYPVWMRDLAKQGNANTVRVEAGKEVKDFNGVPLVTGVVGKLNPLETQINWMSRGAADIGNILGLGGEEEPAAALPQPPPAAAVQPAPQQAPETDLSTTVTGGMLGATLIDEMQNLQALLGG